MKATIFQPPYPMHHELQQTLDWQTSLLAAIAAHETDLIILPEIPNVTGYKDLDDMKRAINAEGKVFVDTLQTEADRIGAIIKEQHQFDRLLQFPFQRFERDSS